MPLKNWTTTVPVAKTAAEIQKLLLRVKARRVSTDYEGERPVGVSFVVETSDGEREYALPIRSDQAQRALIRSGVAQRSASPAQSERVAWRIAKDWLAAQVALIEMGMSDLSEVMLPYMLTDSGQTVYAAMVERKMALDTGRALARRED